MHGVEKESKMWITYYTHDDYGCDQRIIDFFTECHMLAMLEYEKEMDKCRRKQWERQQEIDDKKEYERLKNKLQTNE